MNLPAYRKQENNKLKYCEYEECNREFFGGPVRKYCDIHTDSKNRKKVRKKINLEDSLMHFEHNFKEKTTIEFMCSFDGCSIPYRVDVAPKRDDYPKYCRRHMNKFQRENDIRLKTTNGF